MKLAVSILTFMVCLNLASYIMMETGAYALSSPEYTPGQISLNLQLPDLLIAGGITIGGVLISLVTHTFVGPAILIVWGLGFLTSVGRSLLLGFADMLGKMGVPAVLTTVVGVVVALSIFLLVIEVTTQRDIT